ncbi:MAG TPA: S41 family peptidase [Thermomicrobiales bacterium]|nr:S41 family peptidase [Thermomicrobiales bacterium]
MRDKQTGSIDRQGWGRRSWKQGGIALALVITFLSGAGVTQLVGVDQASGTQQHEDLENLEAFGTLEETYNYIREMYVASDDITDEELIYGAATGMMDALNDTGHSSFLDPVQADDLREQQTGSYVGIGVSIDQEEMPPRIIFPYEGSPAEDAGIVQNDVILSIDGVSYEDFTTVDEFTELIGGEEGTDVEMELRHYGDAESYTVTITRSVVDINTVSWAMLPDDVAWIRIASFNEGTAREFRLAIRRVERLGAESMILDLRGNPGGWVVEQLGVIGQFVPEDTLVVTEQDAEGNEQERRTTEENGLWLEKPLVVLVDGDSASSSEVTAAALAENDRAVTVGQTTYGTGTTIVYVDLEDGSMLSMGILTWVTPDGNVLWHVGYDPMIDVANEPGVPAALPYLIGTELDMNQLVATNDDQLLTAYEEVLDPSGD